MVSENTGEAPENADDAKDNLRRVRWYKRLPVLFGLQAIVAAGSMLYAGMFNIKTYDTHYPADGCCPGHAIPFVRVREYSGLDWMFTGTNGAAPYMEYKADLTGNIISAEFSDVDRFGTTIRKGKHYFEGEKAWKDVMSSDEAGKAREIIHNVLPRFTKKQAESIAGENKSTAEIFLISDDADVSAPDLAVGDER